MAKKKQPFKHLTKPEKTKSSRTAGILLHITSLPSTFGIGDLGPEAKKFVDFLSRSNQHYWQLLPLNPVDPEQGYSPYSSVSSMAGNVLLISPEQLAADGLLSNKDINVYKVDATDKVDFNAARHSRQKILHMAYGNFLKQKKLIQPFRIFCEREAYWMNDFSLFIVLKQHLNNKPWYEWPASYKFRNGRAISEFLSSHEEAIQYIKWQQYIFFSQWKMLKSYANQLGVQMFGDLPFYISYDSVDVWSHPDIFNLDKNGKMMGVAGVPPDYFNRDGQRWGMPTFNWDVLKRKHYDWWLQRIRKNMELYDLLRLDHFRAFADYWEVPAHHKTAIRGKWKTGPGTHFFQTLRKVLGELPFVAEDLGDINDAVYQLRDDFKLPGMKVLQFAFGDSMPASAYIPHNYTSNFIVYTGTHDNNTTVGWFRRNLTKKDRDQIATYTGGPVDEKNISSTLSRLAYSSVANTVILPLQDVVGLDEKARMNTPASTRNNWEWRLNHKAITKEVENQLREWTILFNRQ